MLENTFLTWYGTCFHIIYSLFFGHFCVFVTDGTFRYGRDNEQKAKYLRNHDSIVKFILYIFVIS